MRNPSPLARDVWKIPHSGAVVDMAGVGEGAPDSLGVVQDAAGDYCFYLWNALVPGDWTYWDAASRNPSALARDLWRIPMGNDTVVLAAPR